MPQPEYEALLSKKFDAVDVWQVYADWLDESGEGLEAQRIRCGRIDPGAFAELIARGWSGWFPSIAQEHFRATWENGFIRHAALDFRANVRRLGDVFAAPVMRFLKTFGMRCDEVSLDGAWLAPALTHLEAPIGTTNLLAPLAGHAMPALEDLCLALHIFPSADDQAALCQLDAPRLRTVGLSTVPEHEVEVVGLAFSADWFPRLERLRLQLETPEGLNCLLRATPLLDRLGAGLTLAMSSARMDAERDRLGRLLPEARLFAIPGGQSEDDTGPRPRANIAPMGAPFRFRELAPWGTQTEIEDGYAIDGSGIRFSELEDSWMSDLFSKCATCGGDDTRLVHYRSCRTDLNSFETTKFQDWEYECMECKRFTICSKVSVH